MSDTSQALAGNWPEAPAVLPEHGADVEKYGRERFMDVDKSIRLYEQLGRPGGDWQKWEWPRRLAALELDRKNQHLGLFPTKEAAIAARRAAERKFFGEACP